MSRTSLIHQILIVCISASTLVLTPAFAAPSPESVEKSIVRALEEFQVPGMAVSVVHDGKVWYSGGQGILTVGEEGLVDDSTLFQIGSVSKAFTAAALAMLVDQGKVSWDAPVIDYLPEFRMYDSWVTREFTIRDLLTHRSGLPLGAGDLMLIPDGNASREEIVTAMRYLKPSSSFRSKFDYDNLLYVIAGVVVERVSGIPYEEFIEQKLFAPLGMDDCVASLERVPATAARATPHVVVDSEMQKTTSAITAAAAPAGGINCSASSMTKWMMFVINRGLIDENNQLISAAQFEQLLNPVTLVPGPGYLAENAGSFLNAYALGWNISTFYGQPAYSHGGGVWGMTTFLMILPNQGLAVFASDNQLSAAPRAIVYDVVDQFMQGQSDYAGKDWVGLISELIQNRQAAGDDAVDKAFADRAADSKPSLPLAAYAGTYRDPWYGDIHIELTEDGQLWFRSERNEPLSGPLVHFQYDTFIARWTNRLLNADSYVSFTLTPEGGVERIRMKAVSPTTDFSFDFHDLDLEYVE